MFSIDNAHMNDHFPNFKNIFLLIIINHIHQDVLKAIKAEEKYAFKRK